MIYSSTFKKTQEEYNENEKRLSIHYCVNAVNVNDDCIFKQLLRKRLSWLRNGGHLVLTEAHICIWDGNNYAGMKFDILENEIFIGVQVQTVVDGVISPCPLQMEYKP